ncbi:pilus assembly FimT family protein [Acinetobacter brisouii]
MVGLYQKGITLIELIITLALVAVIIASIAPLGRSWIATAHVSKAQSVLTQAFNKAKTEALKNPNKVLSDATNPTTALIVVDNTGRLIKVYDSNNNEIWEDSFDNDVTVTITNQISTSPYTSCNGNTILLNNTLQFLDSSTKSTSTTCSNYAIAASSAQTVTGVLR